MVVTTPPVPQQEPAGADARPPARRRVDGIIGAALATATAVVTLWFTRNPVGAASVGTAVLHAWKYLRG